MQNGVGIQVAHNAKSFLDLQNLGFHLQICLLGARSADSSIPTVRLNGEGSKLELSMESFQISMR